MNLVVIASEAKQSILWINKEGHGLLRRHGASKTRVNALMAPRNDGRLVFRPLVLCVSAG